MPSFEGSYNSQQIHKQVAFRGKDIDDVLYFTDDYIKYLRITGQKEVLILVSSWSESVVQHARSINLGSRQCRDLVHNLLLAQKLKQFGIKLRIKYFAFDNTKHFNYKNEKAVDNTISDAYIDYICNFLGIKLDDDQFEPIYFNPRFSKKEGDHIIAEFPDKISEKGSILFCSGPNARTLEKLKHEIHRHKSSGCKVLGMTVHSGGPNLELLAQYLGVNLLGTSEENNRAGTKPGNKRMFLAAGVPIAHGTVEPRTRIVDLLNDCCLIASESKSKKLIIKLVSSSAGNGNLDINLSECYDPSGELDREKAKQIALEQITDKKFTQKIESMGAIVEERLDGENITSPGVLAVVTNSGDVSVLYKYDQVLGSGNFFGGSIGPTVEGHDIQIRMDELTQVIGKQLYKQGGHGYFGLDFLTRETKSGKKVDVIEANVRKTGTLYPWLSCLHLLGSDTLRSRTISQDDNIVLPLNIYDLTGRKDIMNLYIQNLFRYLKSSKISFDSSTKIGAFVTFDTHTAGKIGVVFIGISRKHIEQLKEQFNNELQHYTYNIFTTTIYKRYVAGLDISSINTDYEHRFRIIPISRPSVSSLATLHKPATSYVLHSVKRSPAQVVVRKAQIRINTHLDKLVRAASTGVERLRRLSQTSRSYAPSIHATEIGYEFVRTLDERSQVSHPGYQYGLNLVFGVFGRTDSNNSLLIEAKRQNILAYRFTPDSKFIFNPETRVGYIKNIFIAVINKDTGDYIVKYDPNNHYELPTVVYDYDFTATRRGSYQANGDRTVVDKVSCAKRFISTIGAVSFNTEKQSTSMRAYLCATRSQHALGCLFQQDDELSRIYPSTQAITGNHGFESDELAFINEHSNFYIKPALSERKLDTNLGNIFVRKYLDESDPTKSYISLLYSKREKDGSYQLFCKKIYLDKLTLKEFFYTINVIKVEMGYTEDEQFILQEYIKTPEIVDQNGKSLSKKIRVVVNRENDKSDILVTSIYGCYGGPNAYSGYVGDANIYILNYLYSRMSSHYCSNISLATIQIMNEIKRLSLKVHRLIENELGKDAELNELIIDFIIGKDGPVPIKAGTKPERVDISKAAQQTHLKYFLEGNRDKRVNFIGELEDKEEKRNIAVISKVVEKHCAVFEGHESLRRKMLTSVEHVASYVTPLVVPYINRQSHVAAPLLVQPHCSQRRFSLPDNLGASLVHPVSYSTGHQGHLHDYQHQRRFSLPTSLQVSAAPPLCCSQGPISYFKRPAQKYGGAISGTLVTGARTAGPNR